VRSSVRARHVGERRYGAGVVTRRGFLIGGAALASGLAIGAIPPSRTAGAWLPSSSADVENPYLAGNFAAVPTEIESLDLPVTGSIPRELSGWFLRIGPNPIAPDPAAYHWFMGDGMVHAIELRDAKAVSYRNRWVRTDVATALLGEPAIPGQPAEANLVPNAANTALVAHAGHVLALYETSLPTEITPQLDTRSRFDFGGALRSPMTAHPKLDPTTGELLFFGLDFFGPPFLRLHVVNPSGALVRTQEIELPVATMMHDFAITERNVVFMDLPVVYDFDLLDARPIPARWKPDNGARVGVLPRDGSAEIRWYEVELGYVFHTLNAYDDGDRVVLDVIRHPKMFDRDIYGVADGRGQLYRWTVDPTAGRVREERVNARVQELPRIDPRQQGRPYRYGYTLLTGDSRDGTTPVFKGLAKHDLRTGEVEEAHFGRGASPGEGVFVPGGDGEDDGWVFVIVFDAAREASDLVILDATNFAGKPVARVQLPQRVPNGFHGLWVGDAPL
jgi:carotenoid cleavage oxygenase